MSNMQEMAYSNQYIWNLIHLRVQYSNAPTAKKVILLHGQQLLIKKYCLIFFGYPFKIKMYLT